MRKSSTTATTVPTVIKLAGAKFAYKRNNEKKGKKRREATKLKQLLIKSQIACPAI